MKQKKILEEIKKLTPAEHIAILEEVLALVREELKTRIHTPTPPNGAEAQALAGILLAFRELDQPFIEDEIKRQMAEVAKEAVPYYLNGGELRI